MKSLDNINRRFILKASVSLVTATTSLAVLANSSIAITPKQPEGPFYPIKPQQDKDLDLTEVQGSTKPAKGEIIEVTGTVFDQDNRPLANAVVDIWQANAAGRYAHEQDSNDAPLDPNFQGWGIVKTDERGFYRFKTVKPGAYQVSKQWSRPPHIHFKVAKRGYRELITQMYFSGEMLNDTDALLQEAPAEQRHQLIVDFSTAKDNMAKQGVFNLVLAKI
ncbi:dioxygenase family protein [Thalassotalea sp. ND16A]|uniref:dioxygenase family protein n=1 Tax=Thalassotalea sp. ND16A TaxID=1535422 RepID=UPI00051A30F8|nr:protocatechuate 3,4-dioxygenase [Thalassotalea sp. ND16A]KGJ99597.1 Protocatechuate 3,4-dioxygenase [Thalassotalea sp. ND16A]